MRPKQPDMTINSPDKNNRKTALRLKKEHDKLEKSKQYERIPILRGFKLKEIKA